MLHPSRNIGVVLSAAIVLVLASAALSAASHAGYVPGQVIAKFAPEVGKVVAEIRDGVISVGIASLDRRMERYGVHRIRQIFPHKGSELGRIYQFDFDTQYDVKVVAHDFAEDQNLLYAEPRYRHRPCDTPNDPYYHNGLQWFFNTVHAPEAWDITHGKRSVIVGFVDTGIDFDHPDLAGNRWANWGEDVNDDSFFSAIDVNGIDDDGNGFIDDFRGWDFAGVGIYDNVPDETAPLHGTHTAGACCAMTDNEVACAGMSWNCTIMPVKVSYDPVYDPSGDLVFAYEGIQYATDNGADVINLSWTRGDTASAFEQEIIDSAFAQGIILVAAAGNDEPPNSYAPPDTCPLSYPACYSHVTAVAATDMFDKASDFTYYGTWVDVSAPGSNIYSTLWDNSYLFRSSTSCACALVSGVAALLKVIDPDMNSDEFEVRMQTTSTNIDGLNPTYAGWLGGGRLNAYRALINDTVSVELTWSAGEGVPEGYALSQNHPNPFNSSTTISYSLLEAGPVTLKIYNVRGQLVKTLVDETQSEGEYAVSWDGCDQEGRLVTSGIYFYSLKAGHWSQAKKMVLTK